MPIIPMYYIYVPYRDKEMDEFAPALEQAKNEANRIFGKHKLIQRSPSGEKVLRVVGNFDRLYVLVHGSDTIGVGARKGNCSPG